MVDKAAKEKSTAVLNAPSVSTPNYRTTISIFELLDYVNNSFPDILSKNKKITTDTLRRVGFKMPTVLLTSGYVGSITYKKRNVKLKGKPFNEVFSYDVTSNNQYMQKPKNFPTEIPNILNLQVGIIQI